MPSERKPQSDLLRDEWQQALADAVGALATDDFYGRFSRCCEFVSGYRSTFIAWLSKQYRPMHLFEHLPREHVRETVKPWLNGAYLLDPFYALFIEGAPEGIYRLGEFAPDDFHDSEYYRRYYMNTGLVDEIGLLIRLDDDHGVLVSLGNRDGQLVGEDALANLRKVMPVLSALCRRQQTATEGEINFSAPLDRAFRNFGRDHLSARECEVIQLILKGHSNKSIARLLNISIDTVKVYNKRFHAKLEISSRAELFSLFLEAISLVPFDADIDPLTHYLEITQKSGSTNSDTAP